MTHVPPDTAMDEVHALMAKKKIRAALVKERDELPDIVIVWDFKKIKVKKHREKPTRAYMVRNCSPIAPDAIRPRWDA